VIEPRELLLVRGGGAALVSFVPMLLVGVVLYGTAIHQSAGNGRGGGIRTHDFVLPKHARCQAAPRPDAVRRLPHAVYEFGFSRMTSKKSRARSALG
jgi:hypothetical protein